MDNAVWYVSSWFITFKNELSLLPPLTGYNRQDVGETSAGHSTKVSDMLEPRLTIEIRPIWPCCKGNHHLRGPISPLPLWEEGYIPVDELWEYKTDENGARLGHQLKAEWPPVESWEAISWKLRGWPNYKLLDFWGLILPPFTMTIYLIYWLKWRHEVSL